MEKLALEKYHVEIDTHLGFHVGLESDDVEAVLSIQEFPNSKTALAFWDEICELPEAEPFRNSTLSTVVGWSFAEETE